MDRIDLSRYYAENVRLVSAVTLRGYRRIMSMGASMAYNDVEQEMTVVFIKSFDGFQAHHGCAFSSYFYRAAFNRLNRICESLGEDLCVSSIEALGEHSSDDGEALDFYEALPSKQCTPEEDVLRLERLERCLSNLSPIAVRIAHWLIEPPAEIEREFYAQTSYADLARSLGHGNRSRSNITIGFICEMLRLSGVNDGVLRFARKELADRVKGELK